MEKTNFHKNVEFFAKTLQKKILEKNVTNQKSKTNPVRPRETPTEEQKNMTS